MDGKYVKVIKKFIKKKFTKKKNLWSMMGFEPGPPEGEGFAKQDLAQNARKPCTVGYFHSKWCIGSHKSP